MAYRPERIFGFIISATLINSDQRVLMMSLKRNENGRSVARWRRLLCFPIHQAMSPEFINKLLGPRRSDR